jgi:hypothetical protein
MRTAALTAIATLALTAAAEARPVGDEPRAAAAGAGREAPARSADRAARGVGREAGRRVGSEGRRSAARRARLVRRGRVVPVAGGLPPSFVGAPPSPPPAVAAPAPGSSPPAGPDSEPPPPPPPPPPAGSGRSVQARTDDRDPDHLKLLLSRTTVLAGDVKVEFNNAFAEDPHDLVVERGATSYVFPELGPGEVERRTLALDAGEWRLRCTIPTHAERGMTAALTVTG